jgi:hypothetical protein
MKINNAHFKYSKFKDAQHGAELLINILHIETFAQLEQPRLKYKNHI